MVRHGLLICSFYLKNKFSREEEELIELNQGHDCEGQRYKDFIDMFSGFASEYKELTDDEKLMKMLSVDEKSLSYEERDEYYIEHGIIHSGSYGTASDITDKDTKEVRYRRRVEDADIKPFSFMIYVPKDSGQQKVVKGLLLFEMIGSFGVKTITVKHMKKYFSEKCGVTLETRSISVRAFLEKLLNNDHLNRVTLIRNAVSKDASDNMFANTGREEKTYIKPTLQEKWIQKLLRYVEGKSDEDIFEINDELYDDIKLNFSHAGRNKTVRLNDIDHFSLIEDVPDSVYRGADVDREKLVKHMEMTAKEYAKKMIFVH